MSYLENITCKDCNFVLPPMLNTDRNDPEHYKNECMCKIPKEHVICKLGELAVICTEEMDVLNDLLYEEPNERMELYRNALYNYIILVKDTHILMLRAMIEAKNKK